MTFGAYLFESYPLDKLIVEAARASWHKTAAKCVVRADYVQIMDATGKPLHTIFKHNAPRAVLEDLRQSVRH